MFTNTSKPGEIWRREQRVWGKWSGLNTFSYNLAAFSTDCKFILCKVELNGLRMQMSHRSNKALDMDRLKIWHGPPRSSFYREVRNNHQTYTIYGPVTWISTNTHSLDEAHMKIFFLCKKNAKTFLAKDVCASLTTSAAWYERNIQGSEFRFSVISPGLFYWEESSMWHHLNKSKWTHACMTLSGSDNDGKKL